MAYYNQFEFAPAPWLPIQDRQVLDSVGKKAFDAHIGKAFDNPDFELSIVPDVNNYFAIDLFCRIRCSDVENKKTGRDSSVARECCFYQCCGKPQ